MERSKQAEYQEDLQQQYFEHPEGVQQRHFNSHQSKVSKRQHQYPTVSKQGVIEAETAPKKEKNSSFSETKGRRNLFLNSLNLFFETILGSHV